MERAKETYVHPGIILKEDVIDANGLSIEEVAELFEVPTLTILEIVNAKASITLNIAQKIEKAFGGRADIWLRMQKGYDSNV